MRLIKVYSNMSSFRTVEFKRNGISFIVAKQKDPNKNDDGKTYNGVGKSLLVRIIHFCLGASIEDYKNFCEQLKDWEFYLEIEYENKIHTIKRTTKEPDKIFFDSEECKVSKLNEKLGVYCFIIPKATKYLSFRSLIPFFIRPEKKSYNDYSEATKTGKDFQTLLYNSLLLGLDITLVGEKYNLKKKQDDIKKTKNIFKNDFVVKDYFTGNKDVKLTLKDLNEKIAILEDNLNQYKVAEDYYEIQKEADKISQEISDTHNDIVLLQNNIENIEKSLKISHSSNKNEIEKIYEESNILFPETVKKTLEDLEQFYDSLLTNRKIRLSEQKKKYIFLVESKKQLVNSLNEKLDSLLKYLGEHQALDRFLSLNKNLADLKSEAEILKKYQGLQNEYNKKEIQIEKELVELKEKINNYVNKAKENIEEITDFFRSIAKKFYPDKVAGLTINANSREGNQIAFDIDAKIQSDSSDGINNVKIFCYDLTLLFKGKNHSVNFVFHDSRLYNGIDERQKTIMFKIMHEMFVNIEKQYIATVNQNQLNEVKKILTDDEYKYIVENNTILTLTDDSDTEKLLGIQVEISYPQK